MAKPLFRWTLGPCPRAGLVALKHSVRSALRLFETDLFDWLICHNGLAKSELQFVRRIVEGTPVELYAQKPEDCPIEQGAVPCARVGERYQATGSLWKVCPPRLRLTAHEIILDNDLVFHRPLTEVAAFLRGNHALLIADPVRWFGRYKAQLKSVPALNTGLIGLPPGYDFAKHIRATWSAHGSLQHLSNADEQGLLCKTLTSTIETRLIAVEKVAEIHPLPHPGCPAWSESKQWPDALHFVRVNREPHPNWKKYLSNVTPLT